MWHFLITADALWVIVLPYLSDIRKLHVVFCITPSLGYPSRRTCMIVLGYTSKYADAQTLALTRKFYTTRRLLIFYTFQ